MLFNSYSFILFFIPIVWLGFRFLSSNRLLTGALIWLTISSFYFYAYWNPPFIFLLLFSILFNFSIGKALEGKNRYRKYFLFLGVAVNLLLIVYFKYGNFFMSNIFALSSSQWVDKDIFLPLGISFFTFQQIAFLVEVYQGKIVAPSLLNFSLFVSFFPQLIAGPIVRYPEIVPYFSRKKTFGVSYRNIALGLFLFSIGLAKKVIIADSLSPWVAQVFDKTGSLQFWTAWSGTLAYTFQIYFDFSGYSDMALGLGKLFNISLPINFNSPYKALSITDFWRRWHITLSSFLRDYLYIPLGGNRKGKLNQYKNLLITMTLGGLWHGASWTFVFWGLYHGLLLLAHKVLSNFFKKYHLGKIPIFIKWGATFFSVTLGWVFSDLILLLKAAR
jgi:alginate O-acetyltransferase complex protein AlgI